MLKGIVTSWLYNQEHRLCRVTPPRGDRGALAADPYPDLAENDSGAADEFGHQFKVLVEPCRRAVTWGGISVIVVILTVTLVLLYILLANALRLLVLLDRLVCADIVCIGFGVVLDSSSTAGASACRWPKFRREPRSRSPLWLISCSGLAAFECEE